MKTAIQSSIRIVLFNLVPVLMIIGVVNAIDIEAATYYVSTSGNDGNACTPGAMGSSARRHVSAGLACLSAGDTLRIQAGTYTTANDRVDNRNTPFPGGSAGAPTVIEANPGDTVTLAPPLGNYGTEWGLVFLTNISYVTVRNLHLDGTFTHAKLVGVDNNADHIVISGNDICCSQGDASISALSWLMGWGGTNGQILNNVFHDARSTMGFMDGNYDGYA